MPLPKPIKQMSEWEQQGARTLTCQERRRSLQGSSHLRMARSATFQRPWDAPQKGIQPLSRNLFSW